VIDVAVVLNPGAGAGATDATQREIAELFARHGRVATLFPASERSPIGEQARAAVEAGCQLVVAAGGDGTANAVATAALPRALPLGVLPIGTLNHFARDLGMPSGLPEAVQVLASGSMRRVDVGEVNGRIFLNNSSLGVYPRVVELRNRHRETGLGKWITALWATLVVVRRRPFLGVRIRVGEDAIARRTPFVFVGNNEYRMMGLHAASRDSLSGGHLALYVMHAGHRRSLLWLAAEVLWRGVDRVDELELFRVGEATVETRRPRLQVAIDGEVVALASPLIYRCRPGALTVIAPEPGLPSGT
jgi:diacylglycerol kinase family enzyme